MTALSRGQARPENSIHKLVNASKLQIMVWLDLMGEAGLVMDEALAEAYAMFQQALLWRVAVATPGDRTRSARRHRRARAGPGLRQLEPNPWDMVRHNYPVGARVRGKVRNMTSYGAFIELEEGIDGMMHVSDMSWTRKINHPSEILKKGDEVEAIVLEVDPSQPAHRLGMKQLAIDPWDNIESFYKVGDLVPGKVTKLASFGAFVGLQHEIDGLVHISQISEERVDKIKNVLKAGQEVSARVIKIDRERPPHRSVHQGRELLGRAARPRDRDLRPVHEEHWRFRSHEPRRYL